MLYYLAAFVNQSQGLEARVAPSIHGAGYSVILMDTDAGETLPTVERFADFFDAIGRAIDLTAEVAQ